MAQTKLRRQGVRDLLAAMAVADCLVDYKMGGAPPPRRDPSQMEARRLRLRARLLRSLGGRNKARSLLQEESQWRRPLSLCSRPPGWLDVSSVMALIEPETAPKERNS